MLTKEQFRAVLPKKLQGNVTGEVMNSVNLVLADPDHGDALRDNLLSYTSVLQDGKYKITDYLSAVRYVSHKLMGMSNTVAWTKTFPERYGRLKAEGKTNKDISAHVAMYNKNKLVNEIMAQTLIPSHVLNQDLYQEALNKQAELMRTAKSEMVQMQAASSLMTALKVPETQKVEIDVGIKENAQIAELKELMAGYAEKTVNEIKSGQITAQQAAHREIISVEKDDDDDTWK